jgi:hypothetical protein
MKLLSISAVLALAAIALNFKASWNQPQTALAQSAPVQWTVSGETQGGGNGQSARNVMGIWNPASSGKTIKLDRLIVTTSGQLDFDIWAISSQPMNCGQFPAPYGTYGVVATSVAIISSNCTTMGQLWQPYGGLSRTPMQLSLNPSGPLFIPMTIQIAPGFGASIRTDSFDLGIQYVNLQFTEL